MRRVIAVASLVTAVAIPFAALLPAAVGLYVQQRCDQLMDAIAARGYQIGAREYRRGWRQSEGVVEIASPADPTTRLRLATHWRHGYRVWLDTGAPRLASVNARASVLGSTRPLPPITVTATLGLMGGLNGTLEPPDLTYSGAIGQLHFVAGRNRFSVTPGGRWMLAGDLDMLEAVAPDGDKLRLEGLDWSLTLNDAASALPQGALTVGLRSLSLDATDARPQIELKGFEIALATDRNGPAASINAEVAVTELSVGGRGFAPSHAELSVTGLQAPALQALRAQLAALDAAALSASQRGAAMAQTAIAALPAILGDQAGLTLAALQLTTPSGALSVEANLQLTARGEHPQLIAGASAQGLRDLAARLAGTATLSGPQALVVSAIAAQQARRVRSELARRGDATAALPATLVAELDAAAQASTRAMLHEGWLVAEQGRLVARLRLDAGAMSLNGKPVAVADWLAPATAP
jgi:hypothetical protein